MLEKGWNEQTPEPTTPDLAVNLADPDLFTHFYPADRVSSSLLPVHQLRLVIINDVQDPNFERFRGYLDDEFGEMGGLEPRQVMVDFLTRPPDFSHDGIYTSYQLIGLTTPEGDVVAVRDHHYTLDPETRRCVVYLAHGWVHPDWRGRAVAPYLRGLPVQGAHKFAHLRGGYDELLVVAEMDPVVPSYPPSVVRMLSYSRGGFSAIPPHILPYNLPDFRDLPPDPDLRCTIPQVLMVRRVGREDQTSLPLVLAQSALRHLYSVHLSHATCRDLPAAAEYSQHRIRNRSEEEIPLIRATRHSILDILPLCTSQFFPAFERCWWGREFRPGPEELEREQLLQTWSKPIGA